MNLLKAPSLQSLLDSDRGSNDSLLAEQIQLDIEELDDVEYSLPVIDTLPTLESVLSELENDFDNESDMGLISPTPTPSMDDMPRIGSMLRHVVLQGITSQVGSAVDRVNAGLATSVAVQQMIAVGTSHGHILAFDSGQALRWCCQEHAAQGAVSALAFNDDNTRLLAGFARGHIIMIDTAKGDTIRSLSDVITPNTGVLHLKWTGRPALALCADSGGSVWSLSFTRRLGIRGCDSRCLFSGARGEVCSVEPLILGEDDHPLKSYSIVALATLSKFFVVMIRPRLKVIKFHAMVGPADCLPLLAWQMVLIQAADTSRAIDPVLAAGRGNQLYFHQVCVNSGRVSLLFLRHINLSYSLLALHWLGPKSLATFDRSEMLHLLDVRTNKELECIDMAGAGLVYGSAQFKGLATGGNVSPALALAGTFACYNSIVTQGTQLYILGGRSLHSVSVRAWGDRITHLTANQKWAEAIELAIEGYRAARDRPRRQIIARDRILQLIEEYIAGTSRNPEYCLAPVMSCLIEIGEINLLWEELWDRLNNTDYYLNLITEHIENGDISKISPCVAQNFCDYWINISPAKLEELILKIDWECLDLHQVLTMAKREKMFKVQMHLNTKALCDYTVSLTELIPLITSENRTLGNSILVYISSCLAGRGYPSGEIDAKMVPMVKHEVLRCLTVIHSNGAADNELPYPYLRAILKFDVRETLNVISLAFQEKEFCGELGQSHRQRIVNILMEIMTPEYSPWSEIGCLLNFVSQLIATRSLPEDESLLEKVLNYLKMPNIKNESPRQHSEREQAWLELLTSDYLTHIPSNELQKMAQNAKCYRVLEYLLEKSKKYDEILLCYLMDPMRYTELYSYIYRHADNPVRKIYQQVYNNFKRLMDINHEETVKIIVQFFLNSIGTYTKLLDNNPKLQYLFIDNLLKLGVTLSSQECESYIELLCQFNPENLDNFLRSNDNYKLEDALDLVKRYQLNSSCVLLYEKQGDFQSAFNISIDLLKEAPESTAETSALQVSSLCRRASEVLQEIQREQLWFTLLKIVLSRPDLTSITRNILHAASSHVDLSKLVQLVLNSGTKTGNFGDIKHLLVGMLSNSRYETLLLQTTARVLGTDLHNLLVREKRLASHGLCIKSIKCVVCRLRLRNQYNNIIVFGTCGHAVHEECTVISKENEDNLQCPRCGFVTDKIDTIHLSEPSFDIIKNENVSPSNILQKEAPPRIGLRKNSF